MGRPRWTKLLRPPAAGTSPTSGSRRDRLAVRLALFTAACMGAVFIFSNGTQFLMPGPLTSVHGAIEKCSSCHTRSGAGKMSWVHGLVAGDPLSDSKACLTCHKMPETAFNAHGASSDVLKESTNRLAKIAAGTPAPQSARAQNIAFPAHDVAARDLYCATCHQEHQGVSFSLNTITNEQCRSCHVVKFDSFDGHHPKFENYPFKRRTRIVYDHAGHFGKHFPEVAKKDPTRRIPETCSTCHDSRDNKQIMAVAPFDRTCTSCHLDQIVGKERVSGPKGIAFLTLPGLDLQTLKKKNAPVGEWPEASEAALTPFMKVMISRDDRGRNLLKRLEGLNLQDLTNAKEDQIKAVTELAWEVKRVFHALIKGKASDVLGNFNIGGGAKLSASLVADLTASIPRDVVLGAQQEWFPNLAKEMADRLDAKDQKHSGGNAATAEPKPSTAPAAGKAPGSEARQMPPAPTPSAPADEERAAAENKSTKPEAGKKAGVGEGAPASQARQPDPSENEKIKKREAASNAKLDPPPCVASIFGQCLMFKDEPAESRQDDSAGNTDKGKKATSADELPGKMRAGAGDVEPAQRMSQAEPHDGNEAAAVKRWQLPSGTPRSIDAEKAAAHDGEAKKSAAPANHPDNGKSATPANGQPGTTQPDVKGNEKEAQPDAATKSDGEKIKQTQSSRPVKQTDDLLFPTDEELQAMKAGGAGAGKATGPDDAASKTVAAPATPAPNTDTGGSASAAPEPQAQAAPVIRIESEVEPESWAEYGGWYRQDYAIFYRPTGHKDKFIYAWLYLTGPQAPKGAVSPAAAVFDTLTSKDAQGSCTKCHSVDDIPGKGRVVNFSPPKADSKKGRFTTFIHEPHFSILENKGCMACHELQKDRPYLKSYDQGNPQNFVSNFGDVKKDLCQTCHTASAARQDCLLCHKYHVNGVATSIMSTKLPTE